MREQRASLDSSKVASALNLHESGGLKQHPNFIRHPGTKLDCGHPRRRQQSRNLRRKQPVARVSVGPAVERRPRFVTGDFGGQRRKLACRNIGRIAHHDVETSGKRRTPVCDDEGRPCAESVPVRIDPCEREGGDIDIDTEPARTLELAEKSDEQAARARAEIEQTQASAVAGRKAGGMRQHRLDDGLGLRPRHQHRPVERELEAPELAPAGQIGDRLAPGPAADERGEPARLARPERAVALGEQTLGPEPQRMLHQQPGVAARRRDARSLELPRRGAEGLGPAHGGGAHPASARRAARSAVISGSMTSSRASPLNTLSSL